MKTQQCKAKYWTGTEYVSTDRQTDRHNTIIGQKLWKQGEQIVRADTQHPDVDDDDVDGDGINLIQFNSNPYCCCCYYYYYY